MPQGDRVMGYDLVNLRDGKWELAGTFKLGEVGLAPQLHLATA